MKKSLEPYQTDIEKAISLPQALRVASQRNLTAFITSRVQSKLRVCHKFQSHNYRRKNRRFFRCK